MCSIAASFPSGLALKSFAPKAPCIQRCRFHPSNGRAKKSGPRCTVFTQVFSHCLTGSLVGFLGDRFLPMSCFCSPLSPRVPQSGRHILRDSQLNIWVRFWSLFLFKRPDNGCHFFEPQPYFVSGVLPLELYPHLADVRMPRWVCMSFVRGPANMPKASWKERHNKKVSSSSQRACHVPSFCFQAWAPALREAGR